MPVNLAQFERELGICKAEAFQKMTHFFQQLVGRLHRSIVMKTPVDTGLARGNWLVRKGKRTPTTPTEFKDRLGPTTINRALPIIATLRIGDVATIYNNVPYIGALEDGHSQRQAPNGMVLLSLVELEGMEFFV